jgi:hypothetical protein
MTFNLLNPASYNPAFITSAFNPSGDNARALVVEHDPATRTVVFNEKPSPKHWGAHPIFSTPP